MAEAARNYYGQQFAQVVTAATDDEFEKQFKILSDIMISYGDAKVVAGTTASLSPLTLN
ncbi:MAG: hypothetical protein LBF77_05970 [Spirochaetaceae bacterium]|nr:hypothetical protein [Spirochaetaceae bacterium]